MNLFSMVLLGVLYSPRNDPQPWNDRQIDPEMIPTFLLVDPEIIPKELERETVQFGTIYPAFWAYLFYPGFWLVLNIFGLTFQWRLYNIEKTMSCKFCETWHFWWNDLHYLHMLFKRSNNVYRRAKAKEIRVHIVGRTYLLLSWIVCTLQRHLSVYEKNP